jgi:hypothetical protein
MEKLKRPARWGHYIAMGSETVFRSKIDWWLILLLLVSAGWPVAMQWTRSGTGYPPHSFWILIGVPALFVIALAPIRYVIEGRTVSVQLGLIGWEYTAFSVDDVQSVRPTHNPLASPALSLDRLNVDLRSRGTVLISPKDKAGFLNAIRTLNPQLQLLDDSLVRAT